MKSWTIFLKHWVKSRMIWLIFLTVLSFSSWGLPRLFEIPHQDFLNYVWQLITTASFAILCYDYYRSFNLWRMFEKWLETHEGGLSSNFQTPSEHLLSDHIQENWKRIHSLELTISKNQTEQLDYYTLWAHQIKTPITASFLLVDQLNDSSLALMLKQELFKIQQYTDFVLHYLRMETFHQDLVLEEISLDDLVRTSVKKYTIFFIQKRIKLKLDPINDTIITDKKWFTIILEQVLSNALKYTEQGAITISYTDRVLQIRDSGIGIREEDILRVFERGFTGFNGRIHQQSSGLGLYLSHQIARKLGIKLQIESDLGIGTTVSILLPPLAPFLTKM